MIFEVKRKVPEELESKPSKKSKHEKFINEGIFTEKFKNNEKIK